jgi:ring-1,2-phenylacetyl-CoA epoxidase subunit PaaC
VSVPAAASVSAPASVSAAKSVATEASVASARAAPPLFRYLLRLGDLCLVLGQRLGEWVGHAPAIEEDLGLANIALDLIGQARLLLAYAGEVEGRGRGEDDLAFLRQDVEYLNPTLAEQPNGDFGETIVRQVLIDAFQLELYERLMSSSDERLAAIAAKAVKETRYHLRYSASWLVRLGDGTAESRGRVQTALDRLWPYTVELCEEDDLDREMAEHGIAPRLAEVGVAWSRRIEEILGEATLDRPRARPYTWFGKRGEHSEHLGYILAEMQYLQRAYPGARW